MNFSKEFESRMQAELGEDYENFKNTINDNPPVSIRFNPKKKITTEHLPLDSEVLWCKNGQYLSERPIFTLDPSFHAGAYYVQEASSMFIDFAVRQTVNLEKPLRVLDLCAAPGGKTTLLASLLDDKDVLVANEVIKSRLAPLKENLSKWGFKNIIYTNQDAETFSELEGFFDIVLVDAPCSGEGLFRKDENAKNEWSPEHVLMCAARQKRILSAAGLLVAPDGILIYSTCTYNQNENIDNVKWLQRTLDFETIKLDIPENWGIVEKDNTYQFYPHKLKGEGFFISVLKQNGKDQNYVRAKNKMNVLPKKQFDLLKSWLKPEVMENYDFYHKNEGTIVILNKAFRNEYGSIFKAIAKRSSGLEIGIFKGENFIPSHALALTSDLLIDNVQKLEISDENALKFLKKENFDFSEAEKDGWILILNKGLSLGWIKKMGDRINNYLPTEWRIRMEIE